MQLYFIDGIKMIKVSIIKVFYLLYIWQVGQLNINILKYILFKKFGVRYINKRKRKMLN